jgi:ABC-type nickel/cobalt efflux system permease component RcnA
MRRVTGRADHVHLFGGHHHHHHGDGHHHHHPHGHDHHHHHGPSPEGAKSTFGWARLLLMGLGGGLIPCWDAVLLLLAATALNRVGYAVPLLFAFSLGLGAVLVLLGVSVVYAHRAGAIRFSDSRWFQYLPVVSAALLLGIGIWRCREGLKAAAG